MNAERSSGWVAIARSASVGKKPLRVIIDGLPFALFRAHGKVQCVADHCPHRAAPLSQGRVVNGNLECPYHGWQFDGQGQCRSMPGLIGDMPRVRVPVRIVREEGGLIFAGGGEVPPYVTCLPPDDCVSTLVESRVQSSLAEVAENILDATHTHFTHKGILRGLSNRRYRINITVTGGDGWVEARYEGEPRQEGLVSRLLEGERSVSIGRFLAPGIAELEFWGRSGINLATTFHLRQETPDTVSGFGILSGPRQSGLGHLKSVLFRPFFKIALRQDQHILELASRNRSLFGAKPVIGPLDIMRSHIDAILSGNRPSVAGAPVHMVMEL